LHLHSQGGWCPWSDSLVRKVCMIVQHLPGRFCQRTPEWGILWALRNGRPRERQNVVFSYLITGFGTAPILQRPELEAFTGCCRCKAAGTQMYSLYFKCPPTQQMRYPVKAYVFSAIAETRWRVRVPGTVPYGRALNVSRTGLSPCFARSWRTGVLSEKDGRRVRTPQEVGQRRTRLLSRSGRCS